MGLKHRIKAGLRGLYARTLWGSGVHRVVGRLSRPRLLVLYGHCVDQPATNGALDADMKISSGRLEAILEALGKSHDLVTLGEGLARLRAGKVGRSMVALTMDDGYRDNLHDLVPLLERTGAKATVFLEGGAVAARSLPWLHALGWLVGQLGPAEAAVRVAARLGDVPGSPAGITEAGALKRTLKYDADPARRDAALLALVEEAGGDPSEIVAALYLSREEARELAAAGPIEVGGHTAHHPVLSRLDVTGQQREVAGGAALLRELFAEDDLAAGPAPLGTSGHVFAYPYGRRWDFDEQSPGVVQSAGYACAVTTHAGVNHASTDPYRLKRWPIHDGTALHEVGTEAAGGFELLRRLGIDLVE
ncbi:MAG: polysaccharide deacetylase family protein [Planctomycetota bacterium]|nr:polysaccharide deacetylase family protein [Planctomycetota bacterium]